MYCTILYCLFVCIPPPWTLPWALLSIWVGISVIWAPFWPLLEGSDRVAQLYKFRLRQGVLARLASWFSLCLGYGLWAPFVERMTLGAQALLWIKRSHHALLRSVLERPQKALIRWRSHVWPLQWRLGLSTAGGFTVFAILVPALLWAKGPVEAGRLGMSLALINAIYTVSHGLIQARQPTMAMNAARENYNEMEQLFFSRFRWSIGTYVLGCSFFLLLLTGE